MPETRLREISERNFRANPDYKLVLLDRLKAEEQQAVRQMDNGPDLYGVLSHRDPSRVGLKSVSREVALLYFTMQEPGKLPGYVLPLLGEGYNEAIAKLVLDDVLQVEWEGEFVSGAQATNALYQQQLPTSGLGKVARLSLEALRYAQSLALGNAATLSARLYFYNRVPASPFWRAQLTTPDAVAEFLGLQLGGSNRRLLEKDWVQVPAKGEQDGWLAWEPRRTPTRGGDPGPTFKLYLSPAPECMREAFTTAFQALSEVGNFPWKIGKDIYGMLRPDKLVVYFSSRTELDAMAVKLEHALHGLPAQGVPFTAELDEEGLLSWGIDPPREGQTLDTPWRESWRLWVTNHLASALVAAQQAESRTIEPWQFALERLQLEGVDTTTWTPSESLWRPVHEAEV